MSDEWYYMANGEKAGPVPPARLKQLASSGALQPTDLVWKQGLPKWVEAKRLKGLFASTAPTEPPSIPNPHVKPPQAPQPNSTQARPTSADRTESASSEEPNSAIWNPNAASNWSLLLSPAFGSYLHALNWRALGEESKARSSMIWFYLSLTMLLVALVIAALTPSENYTGAVIGFWFLVIWYFASGRSQAKYVKKEFGTNYSRKGWLKPLSIGVGIYIGVILVLAIAMQAMRIGGRDYYVEGDTPIRASPTFEMNAIEQQMDKELRMAITIGAYDCKQIEKLINGVNKAPNVDLQYSAYCGR